MKYYFEHITVEGEYLECYAEFDYKVTCPGYPASGPSYYSGGEPAEPLEFDVENLEVFYPDGTPMPKDLWPDDLEEKIQSSEKVYEEICEEHAEGGYDD